MVWSHEKLSCLQTETTRDSQGWSVPVVEGCPGELCRGLCCISNRDVGRLGTHDAGKS